MMNGKLMELADTYRQAGGFVNCSNNKKEKTDMNVVVYDGKKGYSETFPIRAMRLDSKGQVEVYVGTYGTIYTERYLRGPMSDEHWMPLKNSNVLFYQTIQSIAAALDEYL